MNISVNTGMQSLYFKSKINPELVNVGAGKKLFSLGIVTDLPQPKSEEVIKKTADAFVNAPREVNPK